MNAERHVKGRSAYTLAAGGGSTSFSPLLQLWHIWLSMKLTAAAAAESCNEKVFIVSVRVATPTWKVACQLRACAHTGADDAVCCEASLL